MFGQWVVIAQALVASVQARNVAEALRQAGKLFTQTADLFGADAEGGPRPMTATGNDRDCDQLRACCEKLKECQAECEHPDFAATGGVGAVSPVLLSLLIQAAVKLIEEALAKRQRA